MKTPQSRLIEARSRAKVTVVRTFVVEPLSLYHAQTVGQHAPNEAYELKRTYHGWTCTCTGHYYHGGACKHIGALSRRAEREGWTIPFIVSEKKPYDAEQAANTGLPEGDGPPV